MLTIETRDSISLISYACCLGLDKLLTVLLCLYICNRSQDRRANSGKTTISYGVLIFDALVRGRESSHPAARNFAQERRNWRVETNHMVWYPVVTDRATDRQNYDS